MHNSRVNSPVSATGGVHRLVEAQTARAPETCALTFGDLALTYRELNARANGLAARLRSLGVGVDTPVAASLDRGIDAVVAVLAILKAGGACVPLDPAYPADRLAYMLADSGANVLISKAPRPGVTVLDPADVSPLADNLPDLPGADPESLAYIIYTSGSTGRPKGVEMPHRPLLNLLAWHARACPLPPGARVLQFAPLSFDVSFQEILTTLAEGGTLALVDETLRRDPRGLLRFLGANGVSRVFLPPVMLYQLAEQPADLAPPSLREVIVAGEALRITPAVATFFARYEGRCTLSNHYGPTETHVATAYTLAGAPASWPTLPPIGRPIDGVTVELRGDPPELYLGGACVARGYRHAPEQTAARFSGGAYRTGDLAQQLPDGNLQFLGRADDQVKIRGFRVELGEIEAALSQHPAIEAAAVSAGLVGYIVPRAAYPAPPGFALRRWLLERLPEYMAPAHYVTLKTLPLTASGKVDRRALPAYQAPAASVTARTPLERIIARLWEEALHVASPGARDNFFDLGGNSILAAGIHTRLCEALGREFPITDLFQYPTISSLARHLGAVDAPAARLDPIRERARLQREAADRNRLARQP